MQEDATILAVLEMAAVADAVDVDSDKVIKTTTILQTITTQDVDKVNQEVTTMTIGMAETLHRFIGRSFMVLMQAASSQQQTGWS